MKPISSMYGPKVAQDNKAAKVNSPTTIVKVKKIPLGESLLALAGKEMFQLHLFCNELKAIIQQFKRPGRIELDFSRDSERP